MGNYCLFIFLLLADFALINSALPSNLDSVFIRSYSRNGSYEDVSLKNVNNLLSKFNLDELLVMYIHGHGESVEKDSVIEITGTFLNYTDVNVIALDYRNISQASYLLSVPESEGVGKAVAEALEKLIDGGVNREKIYVVGHSLGAQVAGYIGRNVKSKLPRITGLDPAGPLFYILYPHLSSSDAKFVDIIHTDAGFYGLGLTTGSADFFPNFGHKIQPGCDTIEWIKKDGDLCDHHRSWRYYIESIRNKGAFIGVKCSSDLTYALGLCNLNEKAIMGYYVSTSANGSFYLRTKSDEPFGLGLAGAQFK